MRSVNVALVPDKHREDGQEQDEDHLADQDSAKGDLGCPGGLFHLADGIGHAHQQEEREKGEWSQPRD